MADTGDIGIGSVIRFNGDLYQVVEYQHRTPGNLRAFIRQNFVILKMASLQKTVFALASK